MYSATHNLGLPAEMAPDELARNSREIVRRVNPPSWIAVGRLAKFALQNFKVADVRVPVNIGPSIDTTRVSTACGPPIKHSKTHGIPNRMHSDAATHDPRGVLE